MVSNIELYLEEKYLPTEAIWLECDGYESPPKTDTENYGMETYPANLMISVDRDTGRPIRIVLEGFTTEIKAAIKTLREYPLPWTFSLPQMGIKEKPLEDVLLAIYKKYKKIKMEWE